MRWLAAPSPLTPAQTRQRAGRFNVKLSDAEAAGAISGEEHWCLQRQPRLGVKELPLAPLLFNETHLIMLPILFSLHPMRRKEQISCFIKLPFWVANGTSAVQTRDTKEHAGALDPNGQNASAQYDSKHPNQNKRIIAACGAENNSHFGLFEFFSFYCFQWTQMTW